MARATIIMAILLGIVAGAMASPPDAQPRETREYAIAVDGKPAGALRVRITTDKDKRQTATLQADVKVGHGLFSYSYAYRGAETWSADRIIQVEANSNDNGKRTNVLAKTRPERTDVTIDGKTTVSRSFDWTTSYWRLPLEELRKNEMRVLDVDSGTLVSARLELVGAEQVKLVSGLTRCTHYHLHAQVPAELWFDGMERLVRQTYVDDGHPTEMKLVRTSVDE